MRRDSSGNPNAPGVSGVTKTLASWSAVVMPRRARALRKALSPNAKEKSETSVIVRPNCPSAVGISIGGVNVPAIRSTTDL